MSNIKWKYFLVAAEEKNFTRAAEKLYISQQSLSNYIAKLEIELGVELFNRKNTMSLTAAGESLYQNAKKILSMEDMARKEIQDIRDFKTSSFRIGVSTFRGAKLLPAVLPELKKKYPEVKIELVEKSLRELRRELIDGRIDLMFDYVDEYLPEVAAEAYRNDNMVLVVPESIWNQYIPKEERERILELDCVPLKTFAECPFVLLTEGNWLTKRIRICCERLQITLKEELHTSNLDTMLALSLAGLGAAICPEIYVRDEFISGIKKEPVYKFALDDPMFHPVCSVQYMKNRYLPQAAREFIEIAKRVL